MLSPKRCEAHEGRAPAVMKVAERHIGLHLKSARTSRARGRTLFMDAQKGLRRNFALSPLNPPTVAQTFAGALEELARCRRDDADPKRVAPDNDACRAHNILRPPGLYHARHGRGDCELDASIGNLSAIFAKAAATEAIVVVGLQAPQTS